MLFSKEVETLHCNVLLIRNRDVALQRLYLFENFKI